MGSGDWNSDVCSSDLVYLFQAAGVVLLIAMIGAIVLTLRSREGVRRQSIEAQNARRPADVVEVMKVTRGGGVCHGDRPWPLPDGRGDPVHARDLRDLHQPPERTHPPRSDERSVGKECVRTGKSRWSP